jgi:hypothetical protein
MDFIRPIGSEPELDPLARVQRLKDEQERREREQPRRRSPQPAARSPQSETADVPKGPVEGDDGHLHVDIKA